MRIRVWPQTQTADPIFPVMEFNDIIEPLNDEICSRLRLFEAVNLIPKKKQVTQSAAADSQNQDRLCARVRL